jgi:uncharacterized protein YcfJ
MNKTLLAIGLSIACATASAAEQARVISSVPITERYLLTTEQCVTETVQRAEPGIAGIILGGAVGAALGNQVGGGSGQDIATATGAVAGAAVGSRVQNQPRTVRRCTPITTEHTRITGYTVTYEYAGVVYVDTFSYDPGSRVSVTVRPIF